MKLHLLPWTAALACSLCFGASQVRVFPPPRQSEPREGRLKLAEQIPILLPERPSGADLFLARFLMAELSDRYGLALRTETAVRLPERGPFLLLGSISNPLVKQYCQSRAPVPSEAEGYLLEVDERAAVVAGSDEAGAFYGLQTLRQLIERSADGAHLAGVRIRDWPFKPFRAIKLYLPGRENIAYFKRFVRDFMALYKYNAVIVEMNAAMRLDRHPELNAGWIEFGKDMNYTRRERSPGPGRQFQDSANADTADSGVLEKEEVAELVRFAREHHVEVIPEIPSLTHSYYLLTRHRELAEIQDAEWPDTYCPLHPGVYPLLFDVLDEIIEVMHPRMVHIGHDEWRMPVGVCPRCKGKDPGELYAQDLNKIHGHLRQKNIRTAIYADHLIEPLRGKRTRKVSNPRGTPYETPGAMSPEQVSKLVPKDILMFNWFWSDGHEGQGEANDMALSKWGFEQVHNNLEPSIRNYDRRATLRGVVGGAPSSWAATNEFNFGKDLMFDFLGCANLLWSTDRPSLEQLSETVQGLLPGIRRNLGARPFPSDDGASAPIDIGAAATGFSMPDLNLDAMKIGKVVAGRIAFELPPEAAKRVVAVRSAGPDSRAIRIGEDVSSVVFLHAAAKPAGNVPAYNATWNFADTADLLGWYEAIYDDGFVATIPLRYAVNILEAGWGKKHAPARVAYEAELVDCAAPASERITFFAYEWVNPRLGVPIREIRLKAASGYKNARGRAAAENAVLLAAVSVVKKRTPPEPRPLRLAQ